MAVFDPGVNFPEWGVKFFWNRGSVCSGIYIWREYVSSKAFYNLKKDELFNDLNKMLEDGKTYYVVYNPQFLTLLPQDVEWYNDEKLIRGRLTLEDSQIYILNIPFSGKGMLLFEEQAITLEQFNYGFPGVNEQLYVEVEDTFTEDEINKLIETPNNNLNTEDDVKQMVKIRIAEKFEVVRDESKQVLGIELQ